ncbi:hypothetical protein ACHHRT_03325 [Desulfurivibrio sp. D14AmB]|uniref:hypothetical protein n=1 Tax=Desulfurivibrio sp. D14AmB TaxID=3374370 RepID=UPI00376F1828
MKLNICVIFLVGFLLLVPQAYAETVDDQTTFETVKQETQSLLRTLGAYTADQKEAAVRKTKAALDQLDKRIDDLETSINKNWEKMDREARQKARASLQALREQRKQVAERYESLKGSSSEAWEQMKKGFSDAYRELSEAWERSEQEFGGQE